MSLKKQGKLIQLFTNLFASGFTLTEMVNFLKRSQLVEDAYTDRMQSSLLDGDNLAAMMTKIGFSDTVVTQLALAEVHGNTQKSLSKIASYLESMATVRKKLVEVATYPVVLLLFLVLIMIGLRNYLLPQMENGNFAGQIITHFPMIFLVGLLILVIIIVILVFFVRRLPPLSFMSRLSRLPLLGRYIRLYLTAYYAREWGNLIAQGVDLTQVVQIMQKQQSRLFRAVGEDMESALLAGESFHRKVLDYPFFLSELSLMIEYGEVKSKLGAELEIYAEETWSEFFSQLNRATQLVQPIVFVIVALVIVLIYAAMLLPMYQNMGGTL